MSETRERKVLDTGTVLADLAAWWGSLKPSLPRATSSLMLTAEQRREASRRELGEYAAAMDAYRERAPQRIAGGEHDEEIPEGTQNPYWEIVRQLPLDSFPGPWRGTPEPMLHWHGERRGDFKYFADRFDVCGTYSWAICSPGDIAWMKEIVGDRGVVEPGAGTGYWAWQMEQAGIDVAAYEPDEQGPGNHFARRTWTTLLRDGHAAPKHHPDRALFLCWPSYSEPWAAQSLACYTGDLLIYCGEGQGGCCADDEFFALLDAEWEEVADCPAHVSFWGLHDCLTAYRRKP